MQRDVLLHEGAQITRCAGDLHQLGEADDLGPLIGVGVHGSEHLDHLGEDGAVGGRHDQQTSREPAHRARPHPGPGPRHLVVMGVSGTGKTTVAAQLAEHFGWEFIEGDSLHPPANIAKMSAGIPLDDDDRRPWLEALSMLLAFHHDDGLSSVLTCSALKRDYRDVLRARVSDDRAVFFVHLAAPFEVLRERMESREHFMRPSLLQSQFDTLEALGEDELGVVLDVSQPLVRVVDDALESIEAAGR